MHDAPKPSLNWFLPMVPICIGVIVAGQTAGDGDSNWLEGVQLLAVYLILAIVFYFLPDPGAAALAPGGSPAPR